MRNGNSWRTSPAAYTLAYTGPNIVANEDLFSGFKFGSSAYFPGACEAPEDPEKTYVILGTQ